jgi:hypothetical protein
LNRNSSSIRQALHSMTRNRHLKYTLALS